MKMTGWPCNLSPGGLCLQIGGCAEQENVRSLIRVLRVRLGNWQSVERALPLSHGMRVDVMAGRYEVSASVAFRVAKTFDVSLHDVLAGTVLPPGVCKHCGRLVDG